MAIAFLVISILCISCKKDSGNPASPDDEPQPIEELEIPEDFSYSMFNPVTFSIGVETSDGTAITGAHIQVFLEPISDVRQNTPFIAGVTAENGIFAVETILPVDVDQVYLLSSLIGGLNSTEINPGGGQIQHTFRSIQGGRRAHGKWSDIPTIDLVHFEDPIITDGSMSLIIQEISGIEVVEGAEIACITPDRLVAGAEYVIFDESGQLGMAVWVDDRSTEIIDGFEDYEPLAFIYWDPGSQSELSVTITQHIGLDLQFHSNGFLVLSLHIDSPQGRLRYLGGWTENGVPDFLDNVDENFTADFLQKMSIALPENAEITLTYPQFIIESGDIRLTEDADVWLSFLHEGTAQRHVFGFYTYLTDSPPQTADEIESLTVVFPNCSFASEEAGLASGNRVLLGNLLAGTSIGWFIFVDGWTGTSVDDDAETVYANAEFNPGAGQLNRQSILFYDEVNERLVLGFEEQSRANASDNDFNDLLLLVTAAPSDAVSLEGVPVWDQDSSPPDTDDDGISNAIDAFPEDELLAFDNQFPAPGNFGTVAFENNFPDAGDYDFNDLVITYAFSVLTNGSGQVNKIAAEFDIKAIGTQSRDGLGFILPVEAALVRQVTGSVLGAGYLNMTGSNLESGQDEAVVIVIDDALNRVGPEDGYNYVNTEAGSPEAAVEAINLTIEFDEPIAFNELGAPPYNPFLIVDHNRGYEIHAADMPGSDLLDNQLFGQGRDNSRPETSRYFKSDVNLPWALIMSGAWRHPIEETPINAAYPNFASWVESGGTGSQGWFIPSPGNIVEGRVWTGE